MSLPSRLLKSKYVPLDFVFPEDYLQFCLSLTNNCFGRWWFIGGDDQSDPEYWFTTLMRQYPSRSLIAFAKDEGTDYVLCFDGSRANITESGPKVMLIQSFTNPGYELNGTWENFMQCKQQFLLPMLSEDS